MMHPVTDKFIPMLATHWNIQPDGKTLYFNLTRMRAGATARRSPPTIMSSRWR